MILKTLQYYSISLYVIKSTFQKRIEVKKTSSPKGNDRSPESNVLTSSHFKQASK